MHKELHEKMVIEMLIVVLSESRFQVTFIVFLNVLFDFFFAINMFNLYQEKKVGEIGGMLKTVCLSRDIPYIIDKQ